MNRPFASTIALVLALAAPLFLGCGDDSAPPPPTGRLDGGGLDADVDAGEDDAGRRDAGRRDAGALDSGSMDGAVADGALADGALADGAPADGDLPDAGGVDAGPCDGPEDCDDGIECNGTESCVLGVCNAGMPIMCTDGISCTIDACLEPSTPDGTATCQYTADDALCELGEMCITAASRGCIAPCASGMYCELVSPQCGCALADACYVGMTGRVCMRAGTAGDGSPCPMPNSCARGSGCRQLGPTTRMCAPFCSTDAQCGATSLCVVDSGDPLVNYCSRVCDPVAQTQCGASACTVRVDGARAYTDCEVRTGTRSQGQACNTQTECLGGYFCAGVSALPDGGTGGGTCRHFCTTGSICPSGSTCMFDVTWTVGATTYGLCG